MGARERVARFSDRVFDRLRDTRAFDLTDDNAIDGDFGSLGVQTYAVVVTFRSTGEAVPSPVWVGVDDGGHAYVKTTPYAGKVRRLRHDRRVVVAPSTLRGKPLGPAIRATGRVLPSSEWAHAEATLARAYGGGRRVVERLLGGHEELAAYIELTPGR